MLELSPQGCRWCQDQIGEPHYNLSFLHGSFITVTLGGPLAICPLLCCHQNHMPGTHISGFPVFLGALEPG